MVAVEKWLDAHGSSVMLAANSRLGPGLVYITVGIDTTLGIEPPPQNAQQAETHHGKDQTHWY